MATSHVVGGMVRVVMLKHPDGNWAAYISTEATMSVEAILKVVSDRWEIECWDHDAKQLVDRSDRPWDNPERRPSHADRRRQIAKEMLRNEFMKDLDPGPDNAKIRDRFERLLSLAA